MVIWGHQVHIRFSWFRPNAILSGYKSQTVRDGHVITIRINTNHVWNVQWHHHIWPWVTLKINDKVTQISKAFILERSRVRPYAWIFYECFSFLLTYGTPWQRKFQNATRPCKSQLEVFKLFLNIFLMVLTSTVLDFWNFEFSILTIFLSFY